MIRISKTLKYSICTITVFWGMMANAQTIGAADASFSTQITSNAMSSVTSPAVTPSFSQTADTIASGVSNSGTIGSNLGSATTNSVKGGMSSITQNLSLEGAQNMGTSFLKDMSPDLKQLMGLKLGDIDNLSSISDLGSAASYQVIMPAEGTQNWINTSTAVLHGAAATAQLNSETAVTASEGTPGNIDFRYTGECKIDGYDYGPAISSWIRGPGIKNEGMYQNLYLDTECWTTVGIGSVLFEYSSKGNWEGYKKYFLQFDYEDFNGNPLGKDVQEADLKKFFDMEQRCRQHPGKLKGAIGNYGGGARFWKNQLKGRITAESAQKAAFLEICHHHAERWHNTWKKLGVPFTDLPLEHQMAVIDISFQGGSGTITGCGSCSMPSRISTPFKAALAKGSCSGAVNAFSTSSLCTKYSNRCTERKTLLRSPCGGA